MFWHELAARGHTKRSVRVGSVCSVPASYHTTVGSCCLCLFRSLLLAVPSSPRLADKRYKRALSSFARPAFNDKWPTCACGRHSNGPNLAPAKRKRSTFTGSVENWVEQVGGDEEGPLEGDLLYPGVWCAAETSFTRSDQPIHEPVC
ncbi:unnamed protein product [Protopolystoma xenopodis]|uniref:Uncharacterized protein n=1 Tax=Protopolystoma xenopodis TaxID=117903 RepID=A0A3S5CFR3_9PLAT|nr:unnamed protein product [Protopolystoma xenopodis]